MLTPVIRTALDLYFNTMARPEILRGYGKIVIKEATERIGHIEVNSRMWKRFCGPWI